MTIPFVGMDVGGTLLKTVIWDGGHVVDSGRRPVPQARVLDFVEHVGRELLDASGAPALGVGLAGLVSWPAGEFVWGPHVAGEAVPYRTELERRLGVPVAVDNDANFAAYAESTVGSGRGHDPVLMITFGTGIGGGLVVGGEVYHGRSFAGEIGHMVMLPEGPQCACGGRGCWETLVSGTVFDEAARRIAADEPDGLVRHLAGDALPGGAHLMAAAQDGDARALAAFASAGRWLGRGVANLIVTLDPAVVVVGGAMADAGDLVLGPARDQLASMLPGSRHRVPVPMVRAEHGSFAGAVGAALMAARTMEVTDGR